MITNIVTGEVIESEVAPAVSAIEFLRNKNTYLLKEIAFLKLIGRLNWSDGELNILQNITQKFTVYGVLDSRSFELLRVIKELILKKSLQLSYGYYSVMRQGDVFSLIHCAYGTMPRDGYLSFSVSLKPAFCTKKLTRKDNKLLIYLIDKLLQ